MADASGRPVDALPPVPAGVRPGEICPGCKRYHGGETLRFLHMAERIAVLEAELARRET